MPNNAELLSRVPLFSSVSKKDLRSLEKASHEATYEPGTNLASQDEMGTMFFVVADGEADVTVGGEKRRRLGPGDYFGEMALVTRSPRSADVVAVSKLRCLVFTQWTFRPFLKDHPDVAWALLEALVSRLREVEKSA
ncbi:MAG: cyclic nucleotide-binding domain-containing protein [Acidimicrobiales bacterium]